MKRETALALARTLRRLMDDRELSQAKLHRELKARGMVVGQRTLSTLLDVENPSAINPEMRTLEKLAIYFEIPVWQMLIEDIPLDLLKSPRLTKLVENYCDAPPDGRATVERIAEGEVKIAAAESVLTQRKTGTGGN